MDSVLRRRAEGVEIWLPIGEAVAFLKDPKPAQRAVRQWLLSGHVDPETGKRLAARPDKLAVRLIGRPGDDDGMTDWDGRPPGTTARVPRRHQRAGGRARRA